MNPINQSLSSLLSNPALRSDAQGSRGNARSARASGGEGDASTGEVKLSGGARQSLAAQNASALVGDPAEAREFTRLAIEGLQSGGAFALGVHGSLSGDQAARLLR